MLRKILFVLLLAISGTLLRAQAPTDGLIAYYPFNGNADNAIDNVNHGTVHGALLTSDRFGNPNSAYFFDGLNDYIIMSNTTGFNNNTYTYSWWAYISTLPGSGTTAQMIDLGSGPDAGGIRGQLVSVNNDYNSTTGWRTTSGNTNGSFLGFQNDVLPYPGIWYHLVLLRSADLLQFYVNNELIESTALNGNLPAYDMPTNLYVGTRSQLFLDQYFNGKIDELRIYNRALSQAEIKALYSEGICYTYITVTDTLLINLNPVGTGQPALENTIKIFPNPAHDQLIIDAGTLATLGGYRFKIINSLGQEVANGVFDQQQLSLDLSTWNGNGIYYFQLIDANDNIVDIRKIILQ